MIVDDKLEASTKKDLRDIYIGKVPSAPEPLPLKKAFCWAISFCSVLVIVSCVFASIM